MYDTLNGNDRDTDVDYVMLGCPHAALEQIQDICRLLEGRKISDKCRLWVFTSRTVRAVADQKGYSKIIKDAGGHLITDTCSAIGQALPPDTKVAALDSAKQPAHPSSTTIPVHRMWGERQLRHETRCVSATFWYDRGWEEAARLVRLGG